MPTNNYAAIVTGASGGIGKAVVNKIQKEYRKIFNLDIIASEKHPQNFIKTDIANLQSVKKSVEKFTHDNLILKSIILCAGVGIHERLTEGDPIKWRRVIETNLLGPLNIIRAYLPFMNEGGDIIFISSVSANQPYEFGGIYMATKTALNAVAETLRLEVSTNIRVSIVEPGLVKTNFLANTISGDRSKEDIPFDALDPDQVADAIKFILDQPRNVAVNQLKIRPYDQKF